MLKVVSRVVTLFVFLFGTYNFASAQCAGFDVAADDSTACIPQVIRFRVTGTPPAGTTYRWDFGSGFNIGKDSAAHLYLSSGKYDVKLELTFPNTTKCTLTKKDFIAVGNKPIANLLLDKSVLCRINDSVSITDNTPKVMVRDYIIEGVKYTNVPKTWIHKFSMSPGTRDITVDITDSLGCKVIDNFADIVTIPDTFTFNFKTDSLNGCTNRYANFTYLPIDTGQTPTKFSWFFENASPSNSLDTHPKNIFFSSKDSSDLSLTITTKEGCIYNVTKKDSMTLEDPLALTINVTETSPCVGQYLRYDVSNSQSKKISWQFFPNDFALINETDTSIGGEHRTTGSKIIRASQIFKGCLSQTDSRNKVKVVGPESRFEADKTVSCFNKETIAFTNRSVEPSGSTVNYKWYIKNGSGVKIDSSTTRDYTHTFNGYGVYTVVLISNSSMDGCSDTLEQKNYIELRPLKITTLIEPSIACLSQSVTIQSTTPAGSSNSPNKYKWKIYDKQNTILGTSTIDSFRFNFQDTGLYSYSLVVYNDLGCYDSLYKKDSIWVIKPKVSISISDSLACSNQGVIFHAKHNEKIKELVHYWYFTNTTYPDPSNDVSLYRDSGSVIFKQPGIYNYEYRYYGRSNYRCSDTLKGKGRIKISGSSISIESSNVDDCVPINSLLSSTITKSESYNSVNPNFIYKWKGSDTSINFKNPSSANTEVSIFKKGLKQISLVYTDKSGCKDSTNSIAHYAGVTADFYIAPQACLNSLTKVFNQSSLKPTKYKWSTTDTSVKFFPNDSAKDVEAQFTKLGRFSITLIAFKNGCSDTITRSITAVSIKAQFYSPQPINQCAPVILEFIDTSNNIYITKRFWDFGNGQTGQTGTGTKANHAYLNNTDTSGIDIKLIAQNNYGCADTLIKKNYVKILGPIPSLKLNNFKGCEELNVEFINESKYYSRVYLEYGDGTVLDSTNTANHTYKIYDENNLTEYYKPKMVLYDKSGCFVEYTPKDSIYVVQNAIADYKVLKDTGCETFKVSFINSSKRGFSYEWDFDNDGKTDNTDKDPFAFYGAGKHYPTLIVKSPTNCYDTLRNHVEIFVHAKPKSSFDVLPDTACYKFPVTVSDKSTPGLNQAKIKKWYYDFGEEFRLFDTATTPVASYQYTTIGNSLITLTVEDENGCSDSTKKLVHIRDTLDPANNGFSYITVKNGNQLQLNWNKSKISVFKDYHIYNDEGSAITNIYNSNDVNDTSLMVLNGIDIDNRRYCYSTKITDTCLRTGPMSEAHCNIYLRALDTFLGANQLRWSHYEGWKLRQTYDIYRKLPTDTFKKIATINGNKNVYIDDSLCDINYCYYVVCNHPNGVWKSQSNFACNTPKVEKAKIAPIIDNVSVDNNSHVAVKWHMPENKATLAFYTIYRNDGLNPTQGRKLDTSSKNNYADYTATVKQTPYTYRIKANDICGNSSDLSIPSNSIHLSGTNKNDTVYIAWNPYLYWNNGVKEYIIEMRNSQKEMEYLDKVAGNINYFSLNSLSLEVSDSICFRVMAIEDSTNADTSYSNIGCIAPKSRVFVPNAFSPNGDGKNDIFKPTSIFLYNDKTNSIYDYLFEVYNRWGEKVFSTNEVSSGWDGNYQGKQAQTGVYIWRVDALGLDGVYHTYQGKVSLLR